MEIQKGIYKHYKGNLYEVVTTATHSETMEKMVVYKALSGEFGIWVRPLKMFTETIKIEDKELPRFEFLQSI